MLLVITITHLAYPVLGKLEIVKVQAIILHEIKVRDPRYENKCPDGDIHSIIIGGFILWSVITQSVMPVYTTEEGH